MATTRFLRRLGSAVLALSLGACTSLPGEPAKPSAASEWNQALLDAVKASRSSDVVTARALGTMNTAVYDAWAVHDTVATPVRLDAKLRRPAAGEADKQTAISFAAYRVLVDLFPSQREVFRLRMVELKLDPDNASENAATAAGIGNLSARATLTAAHADGANQLGDKRPGAYSDYTNWQPINAPGKPIDLRHFTPPVGGDGKPRGFGVAHWRLVKPFALTSGAEVRPKAAPLISANEGEVTKLAQSVLDMSAALTVKQKAIAEYWALDNGTYTPPGQWMHFAQFAAARRGYSLDHDVKLYFALGNTMHDTAIATIDCKVHFDSARPEPVIRALFKGKSIRAWGGPNQSTRDMDGGEWRPYLATSASPEHISGHSTFSGAGARLLQLATGSDGFGYVAVVKAGQFTREKGPAEDVELGMATFTDAARDGGASRLYGGIHFWTADEQGRAMGTAVAEKVWAKVDALVAGRAQ